MRRHARHLSLSIFLSLPMLGCAWGPSTGERPERRDGLSAEVCEAVGADAGVAPSLPAPAAADASLESLAGPEAREAVVAALAGLGHFLAAVAVDQDEGFGFSDPAELKRARLAAPYRVWSSDAKTNGIAVTSEWRFPVLVDGTPRALLTVAQLEGEYRAVDFGAAGLARELGRLERDRSVAPAARRVLLRLGALRADLAAFPAPGARVEDTPFEPLASARAVRGGPTSAVEPDRLLPWVRERLQAMPTTRSTRSTR